MIEISEISLALGSIIEKNNKLEKKFGLKKGTIYNLTGIKQRTISNISETAESLAIRACKNSQKKEQAGCLGFIRGTSKDN